jgi:hypothetical protein
MTDAEMIEQRKVVRHLLQCAFAEQEARQKWKAIRSGLANPAAKRCVEDALVTEGARTDAAIDAFVYHLGYHIATVTRPVEGQPIP